MIVVISPEVGVHHDPNVVEETDGIARQEKVELLMYFGVVVHEWKPHRSPGFVGRYKDVWGAVSVYRNACKHEQCPQRKEE